MVEVRRSRGKRCTSWKRFFIHSRDARKSRDLSEAEVFAPFGRPAMSACSYEPEVLNVADGSLATGHGAGKRSLMALIESRFVQFGRTVRVTSALQFPKVGGRPQYAGSRHGLG